MAQRLSGSVRFRRYTALSGDLSFAVAPLGVLAAAADADRWSPSLITVVAAYFVLCALGAVVWHLSLRHGSAHRYRLPLVTALVASALAALGSIPTAGLSPQVSGFVAIGAGLLLVMPLLPGLRTWQSNLLSVFVPVSASVVMTVFATTQDISPLPSPLAVIVPTTISATVASLILVGSYRWTLSVLDTVVEQEQLDAVRTQLAVAEERLRIARDLHDVFGRTLTAVAVKSDLVAELADLEGAPRAAAEAQAVKTVADNALREVRAVLAEYRRPDLGTELAGARALLASAGVEARLIGDPADVPAWAVEPLALVVREGATNLVRHSDANWARFVVEVGEVVRLTLTNDAPAAPTPGATRGSGLTSLASRLQGLGGKVTWEHTGHEFQLTAEVRRVEAP
ncbi:sensor histidine kinase [Buchananella hordeovulneris]|uniref:sensor histidine kinase n=1 Tax=Buchananella hordeovulneris TaxID=52770 RepID=UPI000F5FF7B2|nr:histidine kinase [Buchananella hordeovulneris]RRD44953.1 two-component sensor histidine kinase [Buchananella hordeovulneris]